MGKLISETYSHTVDALAVRGLARMHLGSWKTSPAPVPPETSKDRAADKNASYGALFHV